jgi:hypothetical protein
MLRVAGVLVLAVALVAGSFSWRERSRVARMDDVMSAQRELAATQLAPAGAAPRAGVSARARIRVQPIPDRLVRDVRGEPDFQRFSHRCGVCHVTPDPALHTADRWANVVDKMAVTVNSAGLLPLSDDDRAAILRFLEQHAAPGSTR